MINEKIYLWDDRTDCVLHTYISELAPAARKDTKLPAIIICPGGAYLSCAMDNEGEPVVRSFMNAGYQTFCLQYSVAETAQGNNVRFPQQLIELGKAMLIIKEHADEWHIDPQKISIAGFSAGGNLCATYAARWQDDILSGYFNMPASSFRPAAAIIVYGILDYEYQYEREAAAGGNPLMLASARNFFGSETPTKEQLRQASPIAHVSEHTPPMFLVHAADDSLVFVENTIRFAGELSRQHIPFEVHIYQEGDHGFGAAVRMGSAFHRKDCVLRAHEWLDSAQNWLLRIVEPQLAEISPADPRFYSEYDVEIPEWMNMQKLI